MTQEQLMKVKIKYLEDRITTMEKSLSALNKVVGELQAVEYERDINQGFKDLEDIKDHVSKVKIVGDHELI